MLKNKALLVLFLTFLCITVRSASAQEVDEDESQSDWIQSLKTFWGLIGQAGKTLVVLIVQMVAAFAGVTVPEWVVSLAVVAFVASIFLKFGRKLPLIIAILMFFIAIAVISNLIVTLMF